MAFQLADIAKWQDGLSCAPTALAAISGKAPDEIGELLRLAAMQKGREISADLRNDYDVNDWLSCVKSLGGDWAPSECFADLLFSERPTIDDWMSTNIGADLELVFCDDGGQVGHVFATVGGKVVDTYTNGRVVEFTATPEGYRHLRVKRTFLVWQSDEPTEEL